jgi:alpha-tubulin suppressor-like RCC1 family protein
MNSCKTLALHASADGALQIFWINSKGVLMRATPLEQKEEQHVRFQSSTEDFNFGSEVAQIQNGGEFLLLLTRGGRLFQVTSGCCCGL